MIPVGTIVAATNAKATRQMMTQHLGWAYCVPKEQAEKICK
jgi:hypothetical protein